MNISNLSKSLSKSTLVLLMLLIFFNLVSLRI